MPSVGPFAAAAPSNGIKWIDGKFLPEVGYHVHKDFWNRGLGTEAARACRDWIFAHTPFGAVYSYMNEENAGSRRVAEKNGMTLCGTYTDGDERLAVYRITRAMWEAMPRG